MLPSHQRYPSRGSVAKRPTDRRQAQAMLPPPPPGANIGAFELTGQLPQDVAGAVIGQLRTSMLDLGTALRVGGRGRGVYFGTGLSSPQRFTAPSQTNSDENLQVAVVQSGNARRALGKNASRGLRGMPGTVV